MMRTTLRAVLATFALLAMLVPAQAAKRNRCSLAVENQTPFRVKVHINGTYWGWVAPQQPFTFKGVPGGPVIVYGDTEYAEFFWGPKTLKCEGTASWKLSF